MRISYSALDIYKTCPLKFKFQEIDKIRVPKTMELVFGSVIHSALQYMFERNPLYPSIEQVVDFFRDNWQKQTAVFQEKHYEKQKKIYCDDGIDILKRFYKKNQPWNFNNLELESFFSVELEDPKTKEVHTLTGKIDRIDKNRESDEYEIIDYKTSKKMPSQAVVDKDLQMSLYNLGLLKKWPHLSPDKIKLSLYYVKHGEKLATKRDEKEIEETKKFILDSIREIEERKKRDDFPPHPSALCDWCGYRQMCPMWKHLYKIQDTKYKIQKEKDLEPVIREYFELKDQNEKNSEHLDELKTIIYGFMDEQKIERVFGNEGYLTRKTQEKISYDMKKIKDALREKINDFITKKRFTTLTSSKKKVEAEDL